MEACLYDADGGFYTGAVHPTGAGEGSHFATSPTLHPFFAKAVAADLAAAWRAAGSPKEWTVVEFGAGAGDLARDASRALREAGVPVAWVANDVQAPAQTPPEAVRWSATAPTSFDAAVANEFLDALPFDLHEWRPATGGWRRVGVGLPEGEAFAWADLGPSRIHLPDGREDGERRVV